MQLRVSTHVLLAAALTTGFGVTPAAHGVPYYWDTNGGTTDTGGAGSLNNGTWGADAFWNANAFGTGSTFVTNTTTADALTFSAGSSGTGSFAVTVVGSQGAASIAFQEGNGTLSGAAIDLVAAASISGPSGGTINNALTGGATSVAFNANSATTVLTVGGTNTYTGQTIIGTANAAGVVGSQVVLTGSNTGAGGTKINNQNTLVLANTAAGSGLSSGSLQFGSGSSAAGTAPTIQSSDATARTISSPITFPSQQSSAVVFGGTGNLSFTNTGTVAMNSHATLNGTRIFVVNNPVTTISAALANGTNQSSLSKSGPGTLVLTGINTYTNSTVVSAGTLQVDGTVDSFNGQVNITAGTLAGSGIVLGQTSVGGTTSPNLGGSLTPGVAGGGVGTLTFDFDSTDPSPTTATATLAFTPDGVATFELAGLTPGTFDVARGGSDAGTEKVLFDGTLNLAFTPGFNTNGAAEIFDFNGYFGGFAVVNTTGLAPGYTAIFDNLTGVVTVIPEPASALLVGVGIGLMTLGHRRD